MLSGALTFMTACAHCCEKANYVQFIGCHVVIRYWKAPSPQAAMLAQRKNKVPLKKKLLFLSDFSYIGAQHLPGC